MSKLSFRRAQRADVAQVVALVESAYRGEASRKGWTTEADLLDGQRTDHEEVSALVARDDMWIVLAFSPLGLVGSVLVARERARRAYVGMLAVRPLAQAQGIGRALLEEAERVACEVFHATAVEMTVIAHRLELIAWYERRGYQDTGETRPFPYGDPRFGRPRRDDLHFVLLEKKL